MNATISVFDLICSKMKIGAPAYRCTRARLTKLLSSTKLGSDAPGFIKNLQGFDQIDAAAHNLWYFITIFAAIAKDFAPQKFSGVKLFLFSFSLQRT